MDWITNNIYFTDNYQDIIGVVGVKDDVGYSIVISGDLNNPLAIVVDPNTRY